MGKSIRSKIKRKWRAVAREKVYKPLAEERLMAQLSNLNRTVQMQNGGSGSLSRLKAVLQGKEVNEDDLPKPQGLPVLEKFKEKMEAAVARKKARNSFGFSFLEKTEIPDWKITPPAKDTFSARLMREKLRKEEEEKERQSMMELDGVSPKKGRKRRKKAVKAQVQRQRNRR